MATVRADRGETDAAVEATHLMLQSHVWESHLWRAAGNATNLLVNAGLYRESVLLPRRWSARARRAARLRDPVQYAVAQVNRAEALHNLGRDDAALRLLARVEAPARGHALARDGRHCLRAWIHAHRGDVEHAAADLAEIGNSILERHYAPELHYTRAKLALARGRHAQARDQAERGLSRAVRAASQRNGLFLLAEIAAAAGEPERAVALFERGIGHRYRAQGGASLALYAELLGRHGRDQETARVEELMHARDPQSAAAARIRTRLRSHSETRDEGSDRTGDRVVAEPLDRLRS
jgi:tetratricopeptide (TPR) repeat protein